MIVLRDIIYGTIDVDDIIERNILLLIATFKFDFVKQRRILREQVK